MQKPVTIIYNEIEQENSMKTFVVKSTKTVRRETVVEANSAKEARELVLREGGSAGIDLTRKTSNTINSASVYRK
jgi:hypothetical protein